MTQTDCILSALRAGERLTGEDARRRFGCTRLAARVHDIRDDGHAVYMRMVEAPTRTGTTHVAEYWMPREGELF